MNGIKQLTENLHLFSLQYTDTIQSHIYLIQDQDEAILIDAHIGTMAEQLLEAIIQVTPLSNLKTVVLTHGHMDHIGSCPLLEEKTDAEIAIHIADAQYIQEPWTQFMTLFQDLGTTKEAYDEFIQLAGGRGVKVTRPLQDGDTIKVGSIVLQVIHTPGHSPGSICLYEPESKALFTGDAMIPSEWYSSIISVYQDAVKYVQSLEKLSNMEVKTLYPGHEPIRVGESVEREFKIHMERYYAIEDAILDLLSIEEDASLWDVFYGVADRLLVPGDYIPGIGEVMSLKAYLSKLLFEGKVTLENGIRWKLA